MLNKRQYKHPALVDHKNALLDLWGDRAFKFITGFISGLAVGFSRRSWCGILYTAYTALKSRQEI